MSHKRLVAYCICIFNLSFCAHTSLQAQTSAQTQMAEVITLSDAISAAKKSNPALKIYPLKRESLLGQVEKTGLNPSLNLSVELENVIGTGDLSGFNSAEASLALSSVIEMGGKRALRIATANRRIDLLDAELSAAELDVFSETTLRFIEVVATQERLALQKKALELGQQTVALLQPLVDAGQAPEFELARANAALLRAGVAEEFASASLASAKLKLATMWGSQSPKFESVQADFFNAGVAGSLASVLLNVDSNPNIAIYASEQRLANAQLREVRMQSQRNVQWSAGIRHLKELDDTGLIFSASVPVFVKERSVGAVRSAQASLAQVDARRLNSLNAIRGQLSSLYEQLKQAISETTVLQHEVLPLLSDVLEQTRVAYERGRYSYLDLISARQEYLDAELSLINSATNVHVFRTEIERLSGTPLRK